MVVILRRTLAARAVARTLIAYVDTNRWAYEVAEKTGVDSSSVSNILTRMCELGWLRDWWEEAPAVGRPQRHYYVVTEMGKHSLPAFAEEQRAELTSSV
jgi:DNA-binding PadR family transcriptional regulator